MSIVLGSFSGFQDGPPGEVGEDEFEVFPWEEVKPAVDPGEEAYITTNELCKRLWVKTRVYSSCISESLQLKWCLIPAPWGYFDLLKGFRIL